MKKPYEIFSETNIPESSYKEGVVEFEIEGHDELQLHDHYYSGNLARSYNVGGEFPYGEANAINADRNHYFHSYNTRGAGRDFGIYHQAFLESQAFSDAWGKIEQGLITSHWYIQPPACEDDASKTYARKQAQLVQDVLFGIEGGWSRHITEALYCLVAGFAPFIRVTDDSGKITRLSFKYPSQVKSWITDEGNTKWIGLEFYGSGENSHFKLAHELVIYQHRAIGNDYEGISPLRSIYRFIEAHQYLSLLESVAASKYGTPQTFVEHPEGLSDQSVDEALLMNLENLRAEDNPIIIMPSGYTLKTVSPAGQMPNFEMMKRYCDEKIAQALHAEGSLIGLNGKGAYSLADVKDDQQLRSLVFYSRIICDTINNRTSASRSIIEDIVQSLPTIDGVDYSGILPEGIPHLMWSLSPEQDEDNIDRIIQAFQSGIIEKTEEDEVWLREKLKIPAKKVREI